MKQLYFYMSDVMLLYTSLPSSPHTLRATVDHKRLSVFGVDYWGQDSGHLRTTPWRCYGWLHARKHARAHTHTARELTLYFKFL